MPRCLNTNCKDKFIPKVFLQKHCMVKDECIEMEIDYKKALQEKNKNDFENNLQEMKIRVKAPKRKLDFQKQINLLSRMIDSKFGFLCIDCGRNYGEQIDAAHLHNSHGNENIRFNLHNLHSADSQCNRFNSEHKIGYRIGIEKRYGKRYLEYIDIELPKQYQYVGLKDNEIVEKLAIVRKIIRHFNTFVLSDSISARNMFNNLLGIYTKNPPLIELFDNDEEDLLHNSF
jgi:hypothetical protein